MTERDCFIYVVISRTGTLLCRAIGLFSGGVYNHASLSMDESLGLMYSFGRVNAYNPIVGGFVKESPFFGTFKRFTGTEVIVYRIPVKGAAGRTEYPQHRGFDRAAVVFRIVVLEYEIFDFGIPASQAHAAEISASAAQKAAAEIAAGIADRRPLIAAEIDVSPEDDLLPGKIGSAVHELCRTRKLLRCGDLKNRRFGILRIPFRIG